MQLFDGTRLYTGMGTVNFPSDPWMVERIDVIRGRPRCCTAKAPPAR
ncbi:hypothetical protein EBO27_10365 [Pseudomonas aeruginosa]|nr:hypothetical protein [Pseudomonas aeruginosa]QNQ06316.1 hypothetical protein EBO27_10365 [Pseudomonas aeruginosa]